MFRVAVLLGIFYVAFAAQVYRFDQTFDDFPTFEEEWSFFKSKYDKLYERAEEELRRKEIFRNNLKKIEMHNALHAQRLKTYTLGVNEFADLEVEEFVEQMNGFKISNTSGSSYMSPLNIGSVPDTVDWRTKGYVTEVKNQEHCGSCWAFSAMGSLEGQHFKKTGKLVSLSEQNLVDCSGKYGNHGCAGGLMDLAFKYIKDNGGVDTEASYPYEAKDGVCRFKKQDVGATDTGFVDIPHGDESALKEAVATIGPMSVAIDAGHQSFMLYKSGVFNEPMCSSTKLDHGILAVGYGTNDGSDYWLIKNSWGTSWGMEGFGMMSRNKNNQCGIATQASYPLV